MAADGSVEVRNDPTWRTVETIDPGPPVLHRPPRRPRRRLRTIGAYTALTAGAIVVLFPIYVTIVNSLLVPDQLVQQPPPLVPTDPQWHNYVAAWTTGSMSKYMATSAVMTLIIVAGQMITSILAGYAFAFLRFPFKRTLFLVCLTTLMIQGSPRSSPTWTRSPRWAGSTPTRGSRCRSWPPGSASSSFARAHLLAISRRRPGSCRLCTVP